MGWILAAIGFAWALYEFRRASILDRENTALTQKLGASERVAESWRLRTVHLEELVDRHG